MVAVKLDNARFGGGPGTVVAMISNVAEYHALITDRDGARDERMRLWAGDFPVGARLSLSDEAETVAMPATMKQVIRGTVGYPYGLIAYLRVEDGATTARVRAYENATGKRFKKGARR